MLSKLFAFVFIFIVFLNACNHQRSIYYKEVAAHRIQLNDKFFNSNTTPLDSIKFKQFKGLKFFPVNENYKVRALLEPIKNSMVFALPHTNNKTKPYKYFGKLIFTLDKKEFSLLVLEQEIKKQGYENTLIIPFTDLTNGKTTYSGGRYIEMKKTDTNIVEIDFNLSFNPYCAYNSKYTCPIPPKENHLPINIEAGMKYEK